MQAFQQQHEARPAVDVLDVGCSVGVSTRWLAQEFPDASVVGLDPSPYFLAVAELRERCAVHPPSAAPLHAHGPLSSQCKVFCCTVCVLQMIATFVAERRQEQQQQQQVTGRRRIRYMHALGEASGLPDASQVGRNRSKTKIWRSACALPQLDGSAVERARGPLERSEAARHASSPGSVPFVQDLVTLQFVIHECPPAATGALVAEARRLLRPGGVLLLSDNDPRYSRTC
jgi:SAM-dependent methyltransferase